LKIRDIIKMNSCNDGTRTLHESIAVPEVNSALIDWKNACNAGVLIGGAATGYYTKPRMTMDVDFLCMSTDEVPASMPQFKKNRTHAYIHNKTHVEVEIITPAHINISHELASKVIDTANESDGIKIASPSGIVALKLQRMARYDEGDIWSLIETGLVDLTEWPLADHQIEIYNNILEKVMHEKNIHTPN
jgi:hypothetical protein